MPGGMDVHGVSPGKDFIAGPWQSDDLREGRSRRTAAPGETPMTRLARLIALLFVGSLLVAGLLAQSAGAEPGSVWIDDLTWPEIRDAIAAGKHTAIVYTGSSEQNGPHMVIGKHNIVAHYAAQRIAEQLGDALVYPVMPFSVTGTLSPKTGHMRFPGSVTIPAEAYAAVVRGVAQSALGAGFKVVALMGDHGGGQAELAKVAKELDAKHGKKARASSTSATSITRATPISRTGSPSTICRTMFMRGCGTPRRCSIWRSPGNGFARTSSPKPPRRTASSATRH